MALCVGVSVTPPPPRPECKEANQNYDRKNPECHTGQSLWEKTADEPISLFTFWLMVLTGVLGAVGVVQSVILGRQIGLGQRQLIAAQDAASAAVAAERAYMFFGLDFVPEPPKEEGWFPIRIQGSGAGSVVLDASFSNFGKTPAVIEWISLVFLKAAPTIERPHFRTASSEPMAPVAAERKHIQRLPPFGAPDLKNNPVFAGQFIYRDMFGSRWRATFCVEINAAAMTDPAGRRLFLTPVGPPAWNGEERA